ncbi:transposase [Corticicoccus populi]|uniref:Transposase n=1 Tax=Corticicoccus populi TaxID=1812821 RepID=A0ABW5WYN1_9STAP
MKLTEIFCIKEKYDANVFLKFLERFLKHYSSGKIVMILHNIGIHHAKSTQSFLFENKV